MVVNPSQNIQTIIPYGTLSHRTRENILGFGYKYTSKVNVFWTREISITKPLDLKPLNFIYFKGSSMIDIVNHCCC